MTQNSSPRDAQGQSQKQKDVAWSRHEHVSPPVQTQAQKLLHDAGSPELAHLAVDQAANESTTTNIDERAKQWGFASRHTLLAGSVNLVSRQGRPWWATLIGDGKWVAWSERDNNTSGDLKSLDEAREFVAGADEKSAT
jgi:hypothetical protein